MSIVERKAWHCDVCGFEWLKTPRVVPVQCASAKCRSRKWNSLETAQEARRVAEAPRAQPKAARGVEGAKGANTARSAAWDGGDGSPPPLGSWITDPVPSKKSAGCAECGSLSGHQKWCKASASK
jgi:hypothetical protein